MIQLMQWFTTLVVFILYNKDNQDDLTFRLMGTYITKKGNKTKRKQLYSLGLKNISKQFQSIALIRRDFEKLIFIFIQLKQFKLIDELNYKKRGV